MKSDKLLSIMVLSFIAVVFYLYNQSKLILLKGMFKSFFDKLSYTPLPELLKAMEENDVSKDDLVAEYGEDAHKWLSGDKKIPHIITSYINEGHVW